MLTQSMRPKCKVDTYSIPTADGVYLRRNNSRLLLKGKSLYSLLEHLMPHLNGNVTLEELTAGLDAEQRRMITHLIEKLVAHDFIKDTSQDRCHTLRPLELETYATNIAFIESFQTSAPHRFESFRNKHLLIIGSGLSLVALLQAGLQCGVKQISAIAIPEDEVTSDFSKDITDQPVQYDDEQTVNFIDLPCWENEAEVRSLIQGCDAVLHITECSMLARARMLNRLCLDERKTFLQALLLEDQALIGPLVDLESGNCWECAWRRWHANQSNLSEDSSRASHGMPLATAEATLIAHQLLFALFQFFTRTGSGETAGKVSVLDLKTLQSESHRFLPHPDCLACQHPAVATASQFLEQIQQVRQQAPLEAENFLRTMAECVDEQCGLFATVDSTPFVQVPLAVYKVHLANPLPGKNQPASLDVIATSIETEEARMRALLKACERYAARCIPQRRLLPLEVVQQMSLPTVSTRQLIGARSSAQENQLWTWALNVQTQQAALVSATGVPPERGIASGKSWEEALCHALLDWCNYLTIEQLRDAQRLYAQVDLVRMPLTPQGVYLYRLLKATGRCITVYDVTGPLQAPTFAVCLDGRTVTYSTHWDEEQALQIGLEQALQHYQSEHFQQADYALAPVPDCPVHLRSEQLCLPRYTLPNTWAARKEWLLQQLQTAGLHGFAIPLNTDPTLARALPFLMRVLLSHKEVEEGR